MTAVDRVFALSKDYSRSGIVAVDLEFVWAACERLLGLDPDNDRLLTEALWTAATVTYVRCFKTTRRRLGLRPADVVVLAENVGQIHEFVSRLRNEHVAHSEARLEVQEIYVGVLKDQDGRPLRAAGVFTSAAKLIAPAKDAVRGLQGLAAKLLGDQQLKLQAIVNEIRDLSEGMSPTELEDLSRRELPPTKLGLDER